MIQTAIAGDFQLRANAESSPGCFCLSNAFGDALGIAFEVKGPLIEGAIESVEEVLGVAREAHHVARVTRRPIFRAQANKR